VIALAFLAGVVVGGLGAVVVAAAMLLRRDARMSRERFL
jgi:ethanolamine transporter EutH